MVIRFRLFWNSYRLTIKRSYCGAVATRCKPRIGEDWLRGNDLRDGKLRRLLFVLLDVLAYEFGFGRWSGGRRCRVPSQRNNALPPSA